MSQMQVLHDMFADLEGLGSDDDKILFSKIQQQLDQLDQSDQPDQQLLVQVEEFAQAIEVYINQPEHTEDYRIAIQENIAKLRLAMDAFTSEVAAEPETAPISESSQAPDLSLEPKPDKTNFEAGLRLARGKRFNAPKREQAGAVAIGFSGVDTETNQRIILKVPIEAVWDDPVTLEEHSIKLRYEAEILAKVYDTLITTPGSAHPIAPVADGEITLSTLTTPVHWVVQRFASGDRLLGKIPMLNNDQGFNELTAITILHQITTMVLALFELKLRHNDLKPDAIFWDASKQQVYVIDWNGATSISEESGEQAKAKQAEFVVVRTLVLQVFGDLPSSRLNLNSLFYSDTAPSLSLGTRLLLLRLSEQAVYQPLTSVAELHASLGQLLHALTDERPVSALAFTPATYAALQTRYTRELHQGIHPDLVAHMRQTQRALQDQALRNLREWARRPRDVRAMSSRLLMDPLIQMPDRIPTAPFALLFAAWTSIKPAQEDHLIVQLATALTESQSLEQIRAHIVALQSQLTGPDAADAHHALTLLQRAINADAKLTRADSLMPDDSTKAKPSEAQALLLDATILSQSAFYQMVGQRRKRLIDQLQAQAQDSNEFDALQARQPKTLADQTRLYQLAVQLQSVGQVASSTVETLHTLVGELQYNKQLLERESQTLSELAPLWTKRAWLAEQANDLTALLATKQHALAWNAVQTWLASGPLIRDVVVPYTTVFAELSEFGATPPSLRNESVQIKTDLDTLMNGVTACLDLQSPAGTTRTLYHPQLQAFAQDLNRLLGVAQTLRQQTPTADQDVAAIVEQLSQPLTYASLQMPQDALRRHAADRIMAQVTANDANPEAINTRLALLKQLDPEYAKEIEPKLLQQQIQSLYTRYQDLQRTVKTQANQIDRFSGQITGLSTLVTQVQTLQNELETLRAKPTPATDPAVPIQAASSASNAPAEPLAQGSSTGSTLLTGKEGGLNRTPPAQRPTWLLWVGVAVAVVILLSFGGWIVTEQARIAAQPTATTMTTPSETAVGLGSVTPEPTIAVPTLVPIPTLEPTVTAVPPPFSIEPATLTPGQAYTLTSMQPIEVEELVLTIGEESVSIPITRAGDNLTASFTFPLTFTTQLKAAQGLGLPNESVTLKLGEISIQTTLESYTTTIQEGALALRNDSERVTITSDAGITIQPLFFVWKTVTDEERIPVPNSPKESVALGPGDEVEIIGITDERYHIRILTNPSDGEQGVGQEGWVRRILIDVQ